MSDVFGSGSFRAADPILRASGIQKVYMQGESRLEILKGLDLELYPGEAVAVVGSSGAGKSTLLHILGALDRPTIGHIYYKGEDLFLKSDDELATFRNRSIGFVFQFHHLLSEFTALENVALPARIAGSSRREATAKAEELLKQLNLGERLHHYPSELSGGEKQRVAIARALIQKPEILLADEPTGNLDSHNAKIVQDLFFELKSKMGLTLLVVTHDNNFALRFPRVLHMSDGLWMPRRDSPTK